MTYKEKLERVHPEVNIDETIYRKCPGDYFLDGEKCNINCVLVESGDDSMNRESCIKCWNRKDAQSDTAYILDKDDIPEIPPMLIPKENPNLGPRILDSGNRREFESGAVRDIQEGKGRCDLLPFDVIAAYYKIINNGERASIYWIFHNINRFRNTRDTTHLYRALERFDGFSDTETMLLEVAKHFEEGCKKYGENNWQKGIPTHCYIDSAVRHYLKYLRGDTDEPHDRAFCWNILCCIWTCKHKPELNDYRKDSKNDTSEN